MAKYPKMLITNAGLDMIATSAADSKPLIFTKAMLGDGEIGSTSIATLTDIISPKLTALFRGAQAQDGGQTKLRFNVSNTGLTAGFFAREIGLYAKVGTDGTEGLYGYTNGGNYVDYIPDETSPIDEEIVDVYVVTGNASSVEVVASTTPFVEGVPIGTIMPFAGNGEYPASWLLCNGASVLRSMYPALFDAIGTTYGAVDSDHFNLPDLRDKFIEGAATAGTDKAAGLPNIAGRIEDNIGGLNFYDGTGAFKLLGKNDVPYDSVTNNRAIKVGTMAFDASIFNPIYGNSATVQPPALTMKYLIKAFDGQTADSALVDITQYLNELNYIKANYLPLIGGAMTTTNKGCAIRLDVNDGFLQLRGSNNPTSGAAINLLGNSFSNPTQAGCFELHTGTQNSTKCTLVGASDGSLVWSKNGVDKEIKSMAFPSNTGVNTGLTAIGQTYTAPANGYIQASAWTTSGGIYQLCLWVWANSNRNVIILEQSNRYSSSGINVYNFIPIRKGQVFELHGENINNITVFFIYAEGEV